MQNAKAHAQKQRIFKVLWLILLLAAALVVLVVALNKHVDFYCEPIDIARDQSLVASCKKLGGLVVKNSININNAGQIAFAVTDGSSEIAISYQGLLPDLFKEGRGVVVMGVFESPTAFKADKVLAKHDENYQPKPLQQGLD